MRWAGSRESQNRLDAPPTSHFVLNVTAFATPGNIDATRPVRAPSRGPASRTSKRGVVLLTIIAAHRFAAARRSSLATLQRFTAATGVQDPCTIAGRQLDTIATKLNSRLKPPSVWTEMMAELVAGLIDVFAQAPLSGTPLAVVEDAPRKDDDGPAPGATNTRLPTRDHVPITQ